MAGNLITLDVRTRVEWRQWLAKHHASSPGIWLVRHKQHTAIKSMAYEDLVREAALARKAKLHRTTMSEIERGISNVSIDTGERIARALGLRLSKLLAEAESEHKEKAPLTESFVAPPPK